uniref:(California timema) hypothetical protein n=1 Tax=Timema californicum TaxID=61474 RepID=A0A7R9J4A7_TIMCA|nr:unnamed protein product [Timema californicum]
MVEGRMESRQRQSWWEVGYLGWVATLQLAYDRGTTVLNTLHCCLALSNVRKESFPFAWENVRDMRGGITLREGIQLIEEVYNTGRLSAFDMMEVNLRLGNTRDSQLTLEAAQHLLRAVFVDKMRYTFSEEKKLSLRLSGDMVHPT